MSSAAGNGHDDDAVVFRVTVLEQQGSRRDAEIANVGAGLGELKSLVLDHGDQVKKELALHFLALGEIQKGIEQLRKDLAKEVKRRRPKRARKMTGI